MTKLNALFFPETSPQAAQLAPFLLLCDSLHHYAFPPLPDGAWPEELARAGLQPGYNPAPLPPEEEARFQALLRELHGHEGEFYGGALSSLVAGVRDRDEATGWSLVSRLRAGRQPAPPDGEGQEQLWQARLVLKLAELLAEEEREIAQGLAAVSGREAELLAALKGGEELDEEEEAELRGLMAPQPLSRPAVNPERLARAWTLLFLLDKRREESALLATTHPELHALLAESHEARTGVPPREVLRVSLPAALATGEAALAAWLAAGRAAGTTREGLGRALAEVAAGTPLTPERLDGLRHFGQELSRAALTVRPAGGGERHLVVYAYESLPLLPLLAGLAGRNPAPAGNGTGLLAVLE